MSKYEEFAFDIAQVLRKHNMVEISVKCEFDEYPYIIVRGEDSGNDLKFSSIRNSGLGVVAE